MCGTTFFVALAVFWLYAFDMAQGGGVDSRRQGMTALMGRRCHCSAWATAVWFWGPKLLWAVVAWVVILSFYMVTRSAWLSDPTFDIFAAFPLIAQYFWTFQMAWGGIYVIYLFVLMVVSCYNVRSVKPSSRLVVALAVVTIIATLGGYFANGTLTNVNGSSLVFMATTGAANLFVFWLQLAHLPIYPATAADLDASNKEDGVFGALADDHAAVVDMTLYAKRPTIECATQTEDASALVAAIVSGAGAGAGAGGGGGGGGGGVRVMAASGARFLSAAPEAGGGSSSAEAEARAHAATSAATSDADEAVWGGSAGDAAHVGAAADDDVHISAEELHVAVDAGSGRAATHGGGGGGHA